MRATRCSSFGVAASPGQVGNPEESMRSVKCSQSARILALKSIKSAFVYRDTELSPKLSHGRAIWLLIDQWDSRVLVKNSP